MSHISQKRRTKARARAIRSVMNTQVTSAEDIKEKLYSITYSTTDRQVANAARAVDRRKLPASKHSQVLAHVIDQTGETEPDKVTALLERLTSEVTPQIVAGVKSASTKGQYNFA